MSKPLSNRLEKLAQIQGAQGEMYDADSQNFLGQLGFGPMTRKHADVELQNLLDEISGSARSIPEVNHG